MTTQTLTELLHERETSLAELCFISLTETPLFPLKVPCRPHQFRTACFKILQFLLFCGGCISLTNKVDAKGQFDLTNYGVKLDHITYLTSNLDSLTRAFQRKGYVVTLGARTEFDLERHYVWFKNGTYIELQSTSAIDTLDWRRAALRRFGDHIAGITFRVEDLAQVRASLEEARIGLSPIIQDSTWRGFGVTSVQPLDISFVERTRDPQFENTQHPNGTYEIQWVIFSALKESESPLRALFSALQLTQRHEGWFDYWLAGPPEHRLRMRIGPPYRKDFQQSSGIFIEENGIVFAF